MGMAGEIAWRSREDVMEIAGRWRRDRTSCFFWNSRISWTSLLNSTSVSAPLPLLSYLASTPRVWLSSVSMPMASSALRSSRESMSPLWSKSNIVKALRTLSGTSEAAVTGSRGGAFCPSARRGKSTSRSTPASWPCASSLSVCDQSKVTVDAVSLARA